MRHRSVHLRTPFNTARIPAILFILLPALLLPVFLLRADGPFQDSGQALGNSVSFDVDLADLDGDGDLDAFVANGAGGVSAHNRIWLNQGGLQGGQTAVFQSNGQSPGLLASHGAALADLDNNQTLDAVVANSGDSDNEVWLNDGSATFSLNQQLVSANKDSQDVALGLLNKDSFPDLFVANDGANEVWLNNGSGSFALAQDDLGSAVSRKVIFGDVDLDGDLDAYVANGTTSFAPDELWLNNAGQFSAGVQSLDGDWNEGAALGDLDGDGDLDLFLAAWFGMDAVWFNQGGDQGGTTGVFVDSGQVLSQNGGMDVVLVDVDEDGDLDAVLSRFATPNEVWTNNGAGQFTNLGQMLGGNNGTRAAAAGDLDLDNDPDLFFANAGPNHVFLQGGQGLPQAWFEVEARQNPQGEMIYPWSGTGAAQLAVVLGFPAPQPLSVLADIAAPSGPRMQTIAIGTGEQAATLALPNPAPVISATTTVTLTVDAGAPGHIPTDESAAQEQATAVLANPLSVLFINEHSGPPDCVLCTVDWVLKLAGFEPSFWQLHHLDLADLRASPSWNYYMDLFQRNEAELTTMMLRNPGLLWESYDVLQSWTPGIVAADGGQGDSAVITAMQAQQADDLLEDIAGAANPALSRRILFEVALLDFPNLAGQTMDQAIQRFRQRVQGQVYLPITSRN